jgi:hypothetical protein
VPELALSCEVEREDVAGAPNEDDGRDDNGESGLDAADWPSSMADPGSAGQSRMTQRRRFFVSVWTCIRQGKVYTAGKGTVQEDRGGTYYVQVTYAGAS